MKIIIGLGNPGKEYELTRHNIGFYILDQYLGNIKWKNFKQNALIYETVIADEKVIFVKPLTFMNNSGEAIRDIVKYYKSFIDDILVIQDDISIQLGKSRIKYESTDGGHNGIKSIINNLGTNKFLRLKIGLAKEHEEDTINYVLGKLSKKEINQINEDMPHYFDVIETFIKYGLEKVLTM